MGDDIGPALDERTLVIANHQSTSDVPLLMAAFNVKKGVLPNIMWIMDRMFKYTNFGAVSLLHQDFFIASVSTGFQFYVRFQVKRLSLHSSSFAGVHPCNFLSFQNCANVDVIAEGIFQS